MGIDYNKNRRMSYLTYPENVISVIFTTPK